MYEKLTKFTNFMWYLPKKIIEMFTVLMWPVFLYTVPFPIPNLGRC